MEKVAGCVGCPNTERSVQPQSTPMFKGAVGRAGQMFYAMQEARRGKRLAEGGSIVIEMMRHGVGDTVLACWSAEGSKQAPVRLRLRATGVRADVMRMFGQEPVEAEPTGHYTFIRPGTGTPPVVIAHKHHWGLESDPSRPPFLPRIEDTEWAATRKRDILLCPQSSGVDRVWPRDRWLAVRDALLAQGYSVALSGIRDGFWENQEHWLDADLLQLASLIQQAKLVIGSDSCPTQLAGTIDIPALVLHGWSTDSYYAHSPSVRSIQTPKREVPCSGCYHAWGYDEKKCSIRCDALYAITVQKVLDNAQAILRQ